MSFNTIEWQVLQNSEHSFVDSVRHGVRTYRLQSAAQFAIGIDVDQATHDNNPSIVTRLSSSFRILVGFHNFSSGPLLRICRSKSQGQKRHGQALTEDIEVLDNQTFIPLHTFLSIYIPVHDMVVGDHTMASWWEENGQVFNWNGLPTELKECVIANCMHRTPPKATGRWIRYRGPFGFARKNYLQAPFEVAEQLGDWVALLHVNQQIRELAMRLCMVGSSHLEKSAGLCLITDNAGLASSVSRLGRHPQMVAANSLPQNKKEQALAKTYDEFPKLYPQLSRFATMRHGIRKIMLQMDFLPAMHFFQVSVSGFGDYSRKSDITCHVFDKLPHLNTLLICLPDAKKAKMIDYAGQTGLHIWYPDFECPRILHRLISDRAAEALAHIDNFTLFGFLDYNEYDRYLYRRHDAMVARKITNSELEELYLEDGGGIELEHPVVSGAYSLKKDKKVPNGPAWMYSDSSDTFGQDHDTPHFWPPKCRCQVLCRDFIIDNESVPHT